MLSLIALWSLLVLLAVWVAYPLAIAALAALSSRRRLTPSAPAETLPTVSVIIATREDAQIIRNRVADCLQTSYDQSKIDVVVAVDFAAADKSTADLGSSGDRVTAVVGDEPGGKAATLNAAVRASRGEILVFADAHQRFECDAIHQLVAALDSPRMGAVSGCLDLPKATDHGSVAGLYWRFERWLRRCEGGVHSSVGVSGSIWAMRRALWSPLPPLLILDDVYTPMRIVLQGYRVGFAECARALETRRHSATQEYQRKVRTLTGVIQVCAWLPQILNPIRNPIWVQFVFHKLLRFLTPYCVVALALLTMIAAGKSLGEGMWMALAASVIALAAVHFVRPSVVKNAWSTIISATLLQMATVVAAANGFRGRWNVWHK